MLVLVAALVLGVVHVGFPTLVSDLVRYAICRVENVTEGGEDCEWPTGDTPPGQADGDNGSSDPGDSGGEPPVQGDVDAEYDFTPDLCIRDGEHESVGGHIQIGFFKLGSNYYYAKETLSDGTVVVTMLPDMSAGVDIGHGGIDFGQEYSEGEKGSIAATLSAGNIYFLSGEKPGETGDEQFERLKEDIEQARREEQEDLWGGDQGFALGRALGAALGTYEPPDLPTPDMEMATVGLQLDSQNPLGRWSRKNGVKNPVMEDVSDEGVKFSPKPNFSVTVHPTVDHTRWNNLDPNQTPTSETYAFDGSGNLGYGDGLTASGEASWKGATRIMRNEDGSLRQIRYTTVVTGALGANAASGSQSLDASEEISITQESQIDFDTPEEQEMGERLLEEQGLMPPDNVIDSMVNPFFDGQEGGTITQKPDEDAPDWEHLFYERGKVWQYQAHTSSDGFGVGGSIPRIGGLGLAYSTKSMRTMDAQILAGPEDGERRFVTYDPCIAPEHREN